MCDVCEAWGDRPGEPDDQWLVDHFSRWLDRAQVTVAEHGFLVLVVDDDLQPFAYTAGLYDTCGHPELVVFGLGRDQAYDVLQFLGERVRDGALRVADGSELAVPGLPLRAFTLPNPADVVFRANWLGYREPENSVTALQLVYPDGHGVWPWEPDCHLFPGQQPMPGEFAA